MTALLMFGKEETIQSAIPHYKIDALLRQIDLDRYDDRENIRCNLIDAYDKLMNFVAKHLPDKFYMEGDQRISLREKIFRELNTGQTSVYQLIKKQEGINASLLSKELKIPFSTVDKHIRVLIKKHFIERQGSKKTGGYYIVKTLTIV